jgi:MFS family permease
VAPLRESAAFRRLWVGTTLSSVGGALTSFAVILQVYDLTRSTLAVGAIGVAQMVPTLAVGLLGGPLTDTADRRKLVLVTSGCLAAVSAVLAAQAFAGLRLVWLLYALLAVQSSLLAVDRPARSTFVPSLLPISQVAAGLALNRLSFQVTLTAGPALAGLIAASSHLGLRACYLLDAVSFAAALYAVARLPAMRPQGSAPRPGPRAVAEGISFIRRSQVLAGAFLADLNATVFGLPVALFPRSTPNGSAAIPARWACSLRPSAWAGWPVRPSPGRSGTLRGRVGPCCARWPCGVRPSPGSRSLRVYG